MSDYANDYRHPADTNLKKLHTAMEYNQAGEPIIRTSGGSFDYAINISAGQQFSKNYKIPLQFTEKTDLEVRGFTSSSGNDCSSSFNLILYDNE